MVVWIVVRWLRIPIRCRRIVFVFVLLFGVLRWGLLDYE